MGAIEGYSNFKKLTKGERRTDQNGTTLAMTKEKSKKKNKKNKLRIGTWNVRTLLKVGRMHEVAREMQRYKVDVAAIQETRWKDEGQIDKGEYLILYSGEKKQGRNGVAFVVMGKYRNNVIDFKPIDGRLAYLRLKMKPYNLSIISAYAPTETAEQEEKERFYEKLENLVMQIPKYDTIITAGDFNAQIGKENYMSQAAWKNTIHETTNDNGHRLSNLATTHKMKIVSTKHKHKEEHKITWMAPDQKYGTQIDHVMINSKRENTITDVRSYRGANVDSDHYLVIATAKLRKMDLKGQDRKDRWNIEELKTTEVREKFEIALRKEMEDDREEGTEISVNTKWTKIKKQINYAAQTQLGFHQTPRQKDWWTRECSKIVDRKTIARMKWLEARSPKSKEEYDNIKKESNKTIKQAKQKWLLAKMEEIEQESKKPNTKKFYQKVNQSRKKGKYRVKSVKSNTGKTAETPEEIKSIWREHYRRLLTDDENTAYVGEIEEEEDVQEPTIEEMKEVILRMKNGKTPGEDNINVELIKSGGEKLEEEMYELIRKVWLNEEMPMEWKNGTILTIYKKGDKSICENYRGITLLNTAYKILSSLIHKRLAKYTNKIITEYQCGFVQGRSTVDAIHTLKQIIEKTSEYNINVEILFVDFKQAFDSIKRSRLMEALRELNIPCKLRRLIAMTLENTTANVQTEHGKTETFNITKGVRQGDVMSASLFNLALDYTLRRINKRGTLRTMGRQIVAYADDIAIVTKQRQLMEEIVNEITEEGGKMGLKINAEKTKLMEINPRRKTTNSVRLGDYNFERVTKFKYLGVTITNTGDAQLEIQEKIQSASRAVGANWTVLKSKAISRTVKIKVYKTIIRPIITYAAETMTFTKREQEQLSVLERKVMRMIMGPENMGNNQLRRRTNAEIKIALDGKDIVSHIKTQRIKWLGHVWRSGGESKIRSIMEWIPQSRRRRGRPKLRWQDEVEQDLKDLGIDRWKKRTERRQEWKNIAESISRREEEEWKNAEREES